MFSVSIPCLNMQAEKGLHGTVSGFFMFLGLSYAALYQEELRNGYVIVHLRNIFSLFSCMFLARPPK